VTELAADGIPVTVTLYLCAIKDVWSNRIVGYSIDSRMKARIAVNAIDNGTARRGGDVAGCILHSDRGSQFRSRKAQRALVRHDMVGSMGQVGSAGDNAAMESFFSLLQKNVLTGAPGPPVTSPAGTWRLCLALPCRQKSLGHR
jgi:transposase InsO family protein